MRWGIVWLSLSNIVGRFPVAESKGAQGTFVFKHIDPGKLATLGSRANLRAGDDSAQLSVRPLPDFLADWLAGAEMPSAPGMLSIC